MKRHILAYVGGPITAPTPAQHKKYIDTAWHATAFLLQKGFAVHSPHLNTQYMDGLLSHEQFLSQDFEILRRCDYFMLLPGWSQSKGTRRELAFAVRHKLPVWEMVRVSDDNWDIRPLTVTFEEAGKLGLLLDIRRDDADA